MPGNRFGEGAVLNRNHILTVASNVFDNTVGNRLSPSAITCRAGAITITGAAPPLLSVSRIYAHEGYNRFTLQNNVAVLRVSRGLKIVICNSSSFSLLDDHGLCV